MRAFLSAGHSGEIEYIIILIFSPSVPAFGAGQEQRWGLVCLPGLLHLPVGSAVFAGRTSGIGGRLKRYVPLQHRHFASLLLGSAHQAVAGTPGHFIAAFPAYPHAVFWHHHALALRTKFHWHRVAPLVILKFASVFKNDITA